MIVTVEVLNLEDVRDVIPCGRVEEQAANDGLLRFDRVRGYRCVHARDGFATRFCGSGHRVLTLPRRSTPRAERGCRRASANQRYARRPCATGHSACALRYARS